LSGGQKGMFLGEIAYLGQKKLSFNYLGIILL
jgi:hypothetical protein